MGSSGSNSKDIICLRHTKNLQKQVAAEVAKNTENQILEQLNEFISRGLILVEAGPLSLMESMEPGFTKIRVNRTVKLILKDQAYIESLEKENKFLRDKLQAMKNAISSL